MAKKISLRFQFTSPVQKHIRDIYENDCNPVMALPRINACMSWVPAIKIINANINKAEFSVALTM